MVTISSIRARYQAALDAGLTDVVFMEIDTEAQSIFYEHVMDDMVWLLDTVERLEREAAAGRRLFAALEQWERDTSYGNLRIGKFVDDYKVAVSE